MALDESADDIREFAEGITFPVLVDPDHEVSELYAISNVSTVIWIDADGRIARPNAAEVGTDMFVDFTGVTPERHMDQVRVWVRDGAVPADADTVVADLDAAEVEARMAYRVAVHLHRRGDGDSARRWFQRAGELAPNDFTIRRAAMPLQGVDPFGDAFFELYGEFQAAGSPFHGISRGSPDLSR